MTIYERHENFNTLGELVSVTEVTVDLGAGTITIVVDGGEPVTRPLSADERFRYDPPPSLEQRLAAVERPEHVQEWQPPTGAHDAPNIGDHRWWEGQVWRSLINGNTTEPGSDPRWWEPADPPAIPDKLRSPLRQLRPQVAAAANVNQLRDAVLAVLDTLTGDV
jgi:hypothetical protein